MYRDKYNKLYWGLIIILLDIRIMGFDVLPDLWGYIMILSALSSLESSHKGFGKAKPFAIVLLILSIMDIYQINGNALNGFTVNNTTIIFMMITTVAIAMDIFMVYYITISIMELAENSNLNELYEITLCRTKSYVVSNLIFLAIIPFTLNMPQDIVIGISIVSGLVVFVVKILFVNLIRMTSKVF